MNPEAIPKRIAQAALAYLHYPLGRALIRPVEGVENVPKTGPAILCGNHCSYLDPGLINFPVYFRRNRRLIRFLTDSTYFTGFPGCYVQLYDSIPVPPSGVSVHTIRLAQDHLSRGGLIGIFPEGGRSRTGQLRKFRTGAAYLASREAVPIVPVTINGAMKLWAPQHRIPHPHRCEVIFHPRIPVARGMHKDARYLEEITAQLRSAIASRYLDQTPPQRRNRERSSLEAGR